MLQMLRSVFQGSRRSSRRSRRLLDVERRDQRAVLDAAALRAGPALCPACSPVSTRGTAALDSTWATFTPTSFQVENGYQVSTTARIDLYLDGENGLLPTGTVNGVALDAEGHVTLDYQRGSNTQRQAFFLTYSGDAHHAAQSWILTEILSSDRAALPEARTPRAEGLPALDVQGPLLDQILSAPIWALRQVERRRTPVIPDALMQL